MIDPILRASLAVAPSARAIVGSDARDVAFLRLEDELTGEVGYGECAPLSGLHRETRDEAIEAIEQWIDGVREVDALPPSAAFAVSCAVETSQGLGHAHAAAADAAVFLGGGAAGLGGEEIERIRGARSVKLKIGRASEREDRALIASVLEALPEALLRLDGNRRMAFGDCVELLRGFDPARFEYLEEPIADPSELAALSAATGIPVALDELVADASPAARALRAELARSGRVSAWVLRMSVIGRLDAIRATAADAARHGADAVLSTAYESSYSLRLAVHLAAQIPNARRAHGLGTAHLLETDACAPAVVGDGRLSGDPLPVPFAEAWS